MSIPSINPRNREQFTMALLSEIEPTTSNRVMDLVKTAGIDVSDWRKFKGGAAKAASNPKYCYSWSFVQPGKVIVLNLWYANMVERSGKVLHEMNARGFAREIARKSRTTVWQRRAEEMDQAIQIAVRDKLPVRVIVCAGEMRKIQDEKSRASKVRHRILDPLPWTVARYDQRTGKCIIVRGDISEKYVDQFSVAETPLMVTRRKLSGQAFVRSGDVRRRVLLRAAGRCEWCRKPGFSMDGGRVYLETHHVLPFSEGGADNEANVVALCANHHREAHFAVHRDLYRYAFLGTWSD